MKHMQKTLAAILALLLVLFSLPTATLGADNVSAFDTIFAISGEKKGGSANFNQDATGGNIGAMSDDFEVTYENVDFGENGVYGFSVVTALDATSYSPVTLTVKDESSNVIATISNIATDGWNDYRMTYAPVNSDITGVHTITLSFDRGLFGNLKSFRFYNKLERYAFSEVHAQNFDEKSANITASENGISGLSTGEYAQYNEMLFDVAPAAFSATLKAPQNQGTIQVRAGSMDAAPIAELPVVNTNGEYLTLFAPITEAAELTGTQNIFLTFNGDEICELQSFAFLTETKDAYAEIPAYYPDGTFYKDETQKIDVRVDGKYLGGTKDGNGAYYNAVDFGNDMPVAFQAVYACGPGGAAGTSIEIRLDTPASEPILLFPVEQTADWINEEGFVNRSISIPESLNITGIHRVYITFKANSQANFRSFSFVSSAMAGANLAVDAKDTFIVDENGNEIYPELTTSHTTYQAKTIINNLATTPKDAYLYFALMNADNTVKEIVTNVVTANAGATNAELTLTLSEAPAVGQYFKFFVWNGAMDPCLKEVKQLNCEAAPIYENPRTIEAESCNNQSNGVNVGANKIGSLNNGAWTQYRSINFGTEGYKTFTAFLGTADTSGVGMVNVYIDSLSSTPIAALNVKNTGSYSNFELQYAKITQEISGIHDVYLSFSGKTGICDMDWFKFSDEEIPDGKLQDPVLYNDDDSQIIYTNMEAQTGEGYQNGDYHVATENGAAYEITFKGTGIDIYAPLSPNCDKASVTLDGESAGTINAYSKTEQINRTVFTLSGLTYGTHTLRVEKTNGAQMILDAFKVYQRPIKVACVGDSITAGSGITNGRTYPVQLGQFLGSGYYVQNFGNSGKTLLEAPDNACYLNTDTFTNSKNFSPDIVIIMLGTNDSKTGNWIVGVKEDFISDYVKLINIYKNLPSNPRVYINTCTCAYDGNFGIQDSVVSGEMKGLIYQVGELTDCPVIDVNTATQNMKELFPDNIHPNSEGAGVIAQFVANHIPCPKQD